MRSRWWWGVGPVALGVTAGCQGPFGSRTGDYAPAIPPERLREIASLGLERVEQAPMETTPEVNRFEGLERVAISLEEARAAALSNNLDLKVAVVDPTIANEALTAEEAAFEAAFTTSALWRETDSPTASELSDAQAEFGSVTPGVTIPLRTGGTATVSLPIGYSKTNNVFSILNPAYTSDLQFSISHPLLRDAGRHATMHGIRIASYNVQISEAQTKLSVLTQLAAVDRAYWRLYAAQEVLKVRQQQYELAQAQLERAERRFQAGDVAEVEVIRAQSGVADRLGAILQAQNAVLTLQRELKRVMRIPGLDVDSETMLELRSLPDPVVYELEPARLIDLAMVNRMDLLQEELRLAQDAANIRFRENQALPRLDATATYTINGLGGDLGESLDVMSDNDFADWSVGLTATVPLGNEAAISQLRRAVLTRIQRLYTREARQQTIRQEVLDAVDSLRADWQRILAARQAVILNARTLEAEQRQNLQGLSTVTDVLDAATRLADAQLAEIQAIVDYEVSQINLAAATGTLLGAAKVSWEPAPTAAVDGWWIAPRAAEQRGGG